MLQQVPNDKLVDFLPFFKDLKHLKNLLVMSAIRCTATGYVDNLDGPEIILYNRGRYCHIAGNHKSPRIAEILGMIPEKKAMIIPNQKWARVLKNHWENLEYFTRTDFSSRNLRLEDVQRLIILSDEFTVERVTLENAEQDDVLPGHLDHYGGPEGFIREGLGFHIKKGKKVVCLIAGDMAPVPITGSIEIYLETHPDYRRRGLATAVSATFIEYCLKQGIEPHWDAGNEVSVKLALKLGYTDPEPYKCYYWKNNKE